ncbi:hypothetical protein [Paenibacillus sp. Root444D2]|uniref:hypothetical protein n=1 Tax=Paenibacillus sp. Root444D2 TaxID=1736538 RepID=UPI00070A34C3|nr:hypothetical protein [Paenibacillus sp. Root444D2]KQX69214.1 hypothetical protein ASD40_01570 [Paenibacillus sp. Root444D2]
MLLFRRITGALGYLLNFKKNIRDTWGQLLTLLIPLALSIPYFQGIIVSKLYYLVPAIAVFLIGYIHSVSKQATISDLTEEHEDAIEQRDSLRNELEAIPERIIKSLFYLFNFTYSERITIYRFNESEFVPVGRYARNAEFKKNGRQSYPKHEGFIGLAWINGDSISSELPDPNRAKQGYVNMVKNQCSIDDMTISNMQMKSRSYYCKNLDNSDGEPVAVIVFESINPQLPTDVEEIKKILNGSIGQLLTNTIRVNLH